MTFHSISEMKIHITIIILSVSRIYGPKYVNNEWKTQTNEEIINMFNTPDMFSAVKSKRIEWLGHVQRMERDRGVKTIFEDKPSGRWRVGRPN
jgi:hypothetical protein